MRWISLVAKWGISWFSVFRKSPGDWVGFSFVMNLTRSCSDLIGCWSNVYYRKNIAISGKLICEFLAIQEFNVWKQLFYSISLSISLVQFNEQCEREILLFRWRNWYHLLGEAVKIVLEWCIISSKAEDLLLQNILLTSPDLVFEPSFACKVYFLKLIQKFLRSDFVVMFWQQGERFPFTVEWIRLLLSQKFRPKFCPEW